MREQAPGRATLREKVVGQFQGTLSSVRLSLRQSRGDTIVQERHAAGSGISYSIWGTAVVKALLLAKFMLLARDLRLGKEFRGRPLIWPTLYQALVFLVFLLVLMTLEELVVGLLHHRAVADSLARVVGSTLFHGFAVCLLGYLLLVPYSAFICLGEVLGEHELIRMFFGSRSPVVPKMKVT